MNKIDKKEIIKAFIIKDNPFYCDDCLSEELKIGSWQVINYYVRKLYSKGGYNREERECEKCIKKKLLLHK